MLDLTLLATRSKASGRMTDSRTMRHSISRSAGLLKSSESQTKVSSPTSTTSRTHESRSSLVHFDVSTANSGRAASTHSSASFTT
eukprot:scaffold2329_cov247-Pinguiococcus_pyrenoidosus.AAC.6